jgi:hypothetical protein
VVLFGSFFIWKIWNFIFVIKHFNKYPTLFVAVLLLCTSWLINHSRFFVFLLKSRIIGRILPCQEIVQEMKDSISLDKTLLDATVDSGDQGRIWRNFGQQWRESKWYKNFDRTGLMVGGTVAKASMTIEESEDFLSSVCLEVTCAASLGRTDDAYQEEFNDSVVFFFSSFFVTKIKI